MIFSPDNHLYDLAGRYRWTPPRAKDVEHAAVAKGNTNFPGVGWPGVHGRVKR